MRGLNEVDSRGFQISLLHIRPVDDIPDFLHVVGLDVSVRQVEGVLPHVQAQQRDGPSRGARVLVRARHNREALGVRVVC